MRRMLFITTALFITTPALAASAPPVALTHVRIVDGTGARPIEDATLVMQGDHILAAGKNVDIPKDAKVLDRSGDTALPGIISDHSHVGQYEGVTTGSQFYTRANIMAALGQYRRYGVTTVTALGNNVPDVFDPLRKEAHAGKTPADLFGVDQGIGVPKGAPPVNVAPDQLFRPKTAHEAREAVDTMADEGTDLVKIWVDDFDGTLPVKMSPDIIAAVVEESHKRKLRVAAHIHDLEKEAHAGKTPADLFGVDQGIGVPKGAPPVNVAPDQLFRPKTAHEAREAVDTMADEGTDLVKIWVDDFDGTLPVKMSPDIIAAVVEESHKRKLRVAAHIHDLEDAQHVVAAGVDILAHGIRDKPVTPDLIATLKARRIWYIATLQLDEATTAWADRAPWTQTPFAIAGLSGPLLKQINDPAWQAQHKAGKQADFARTSLEMNLQNLKTLHDAGVKIGFGTDSGATPLRVPGVAEHRELALTVQAGLTPLETIHIATQNAADLLNLSDRGVLAPGKRADVLVVAGNPATNIANADKIIETWENGVAISAPVLQK